MENGGVDRTGNGGAGGTGTVVTEQTSDEDIMIVGFVLAVVSLIIFVCILVVWLPKDKAQSQNRVPALT